MVCTQLGYTPKCSLLLDSTEDEHFKMVINTARNQ